jgi:predicted TIM-barrel fold metal-dependent hydrolase
MDVTMPVFDSHVHIFPDAIALPAVTAMGRAAGIEPDYDGTRASLVKRLGDAGCDGAMNCPVATAPKQVRSINDWCAAINEWPVLSLGSVHPDFPNPVAELERIHSLGLYGIKLHPEYQSFTPDDPRLDAIWESCVGLGLPVVIHAGEDIGFEPPYHSDPARLAKLVERVPGLTLIAAHLGGYRNWDEVETCLAGTPVYLDLSFALGELPDDQVMRIIRRHGSHRILYGTDAPWQNPCDYLRRFAALPLGPRDRRWIQWDNAAELFGLAPPESAAPPEEEKEPFPWQERDRVLALPDDALLAECRADTFRGSGRGGQKRNRTESAVRVTHLGSGIAASNDESRSQHTNRQLALRLLRWELALAGRNPEPPPTADGQLPGWRTPAYAAWLATALDHVAACDCHVGQAARKLGLSTGKLVHELARHSRVWDAVNQARAERGLPPLARR